MGLSTCRNLRQGRENLREYPHAAERFGPSVNGGLAALAGNDGRRVSGTAVALGEPVKAERNLSRSVETERAREIGNERRNGTYAPLSKTKRSEVQARPDGGVDVRDDALLRGRSERILADRPASHADGLLSPAGFLGSNAAGVPPSATTRTEYRFDLESAGQRVALRRDRDRGSTATLRWTGLRDGLQRKIWSFDRHRSEACGSHASGGCE